MVLRVGAGGWAYFRVPGQSNLKAYSSAFDFVEVNSTYYEHPSLRTVSQWRRTVPENFEFAVRCHRSIVDAVSSKPGTGISKVLDKMEPVCKALRASVLAVLLPSDQVRTPDSIAKLEDLLTTFGVPGTRVGVELRGAPPEERVFKLMETHGAIHSVDLSREEPKYESDILYSRLFGKGQENIYEFDDSELRDVAAKASAPKFEKSILAFHGVRMYRDASRLKLFVTTGEFPSITGQTGLESFRTVLSEDARFPATKDELVRIQGWKLFDLSPKNRVRTSTYLNKLPRGTYHSLDSVVFSLKDQFVP